jgi:hypothetical protein
VLCVLVDAKNVANLRLKLPANGGYGEVAVHDLAAAPVKFPSLEHALSHFANPKVRCAFSIGIYTRGCHWIPRLLA